MSAGDGFFKRGKIWWFRTDPITGAQASSGKRDFESAKLEYTVRSRLASDPSYQPAHSKADQSLNHWAVKFVEHKRATKAAHTAKFYSDKLGHVVRLLGADTPISNALRPANMDAYALTRKGEGARATTIRKEIGAARTLGRWAARQGAYHGRPELLMPSDLADDYEPGERALTPEEACGLLDHLSRHRMAWVALAVATGCRYSETPRVQPEDVDTARWLVRIRGTKTKKAKRVVPIAEPFRRILAAARHELPLRPWLNANMKRDLALACRKAGIAPVTANDLRRTHGSWLSAGGVDDENIGKVLGHTDGRMARRVYAKLRPEQLGAVVAAKMGATKAQQSGRQAPTEKTETEADSEASEPREDWIENPRVGGSIPSRDTEETSTILGFTAFGARRSVAQTDAKARSVRNDSATAETSDFVKRRSQVQIQQSAPGVTPSGVGPLCGQFINEGDSHGRSTRNDAAAQHTDVGDPGLDRAAPDSEGGHRRAEGGPQEPRAGSGYHEAGGSPALGGRSDVRRVGAPRLGPRCGQSDDDGTWALPGNIGAPGWFGAEPPPVVAQEFDLPQGWGP